MSEENSVMVDGITLIGWPAKLMKRMDKVEELTREKLADYERRIAQMEEKIDLMRNEVNII